MLGLLKQDLSKTLIDMALSSIINEDITIRIGDKVALFLRIEESGKAEDGRTVYKVSGRLVK